MCPKPQRADNERCTLFIYPNSRQAHCGNLVSPSDSREIITYLPNLIGQIGFDRTPQARVKYLFKKNCLLMCSQLYY